MSISTDSTYPARRAPEGRPPVVVAGVNGPRLCLLIPCRRSTAEGAGRDHLTVPEREAGPLDRRGYGELLNAEEEAVHDGGVAVGGREGEWGVAPSCLEGELLWVGGV